MASLPRRDDVRSVTCRFGGEWVANRLFVNKRPLYVDDAFGVDKASGKPLFSADELHRFDIKGPVLGVPLVFWGSPVGALIVWEYGSGRRPVWDDREELARHAKLSITTVGRADSEQRRQQRLTALRGLLDRIPTGRKRAPLNQILIEILRGIVEGGFDRARVLRLKRPRPNKPRVAICQASYGVEDKNSFTDEEIDDTSLHLRDIIDRADRGHFEAGIHEADKQGRVFPYRGKFLLPPGHPLAYAPLKVSGRLYGHLTADNSKTARVITEDDLEQLGLAAIVTAQIIQSYPSRSDTHGERRVPAKAKGS